tara:strand:- start:1156 stop:2637 length:1482 start_codon:yes stop_codon:yes gene_type:complete
MRDIFLEFVRFNKQNPEIYAAVEKFTREVIHTGRVQYSVNAIFERIRWHTEIETRGEDFKLNNNYRACYARMFMYRNSRHGEFFKVRDMRGEWRLLKWLKKNYPKENDMAQHSDLGPSATSRWMNCPGSINACKDYPRETNVYAAQGTAAHEVGEKCLKKGVDASDWAGEVMEVEGMTFTVDREMIAGVQLYLDVVRNDAEKMKAKIHVEKRFDLSKVYPNIFGTADAVLIKGKLLKVYDLKYGRGVVEVRENSQALCYAIGALLLLDKHREVEEIEMVIVQPRVTDPVKRWTVTRKYINKFAKELRAAAIATEAPDAPRIAGEKQCQWCQHKPHCPEVKALVMEKAMIDFDDDGDMILPDVEDLGSNSIAELMKWLPFLQSYMKSIESRALHMLEAGNKVEGFKLIDKVGRRAWEDEAKAVRGLKKLGLDEEDIFHPAAMLSPSQMGKLLTKELRDDMDEFVVKKVSGTKMVPENDPAPEVGAGIVSDFADD